MDDLNTVTKVFSAVFVALTGAVGWMAKAFWNKSDATEKKLLKRWEECEAKHEASNNKVTELSQKVGQLEGQVMGVQSMAELHKDVLREVANCPAKRPPRDAPPV